MSTDGQDSADTTEAGDGEDSQSTVSLEYPEESWLGFIREHLGPSLLWALIAIGSSHIVLSPTLGGLYGVFTVWLAILVFFVKYGGWELGVRYSYGVGRHPVEGYGDLPGPDQWAQWATLFLVCGVQTIVSSSVGVATASFLSVLVPGLDRLLLFLLISVSVGLFILFSEYDLIETVLSIFVISLGVLVILGIFVAPPSANRIANTVFMTPDFSSALFLSLFGSLVGFAPTGLATSISLGSWSLAKEQGASALREKDIDPHDPEYQDYIAAWIRTGRRDFNIGYGFTLVLMIAMILLSASVLYPNPPTDENLAVAIGQLLQESFGDWAFWAIIVGAFAALLSTYITLVDSISRVASDIIPMVLERNVDTEGIRKRIVIVVIFINIIPVLVIGALPVTLTITASVLVAGVQFFYYIANYYIVRKHLSERFQPGGVAKVYYVVSILLVFIFGLLGVAAELGFIG